VGLQIREEVDVSLMITVRNKKTYKGPGEYVGRGSVLGNQFKMKNKSHEERMRVIQEFRVWLWKQMQANNKEVMKELYRLLGLAMDGELNLICWCAPEECHADVIKSAIEYIHRELEDEFQQVFARRLNERSF